MADKEATIYIIDVGKSMGRKNRRDLSDLDWSMKWIEDKLTNVVYLARKTLVVGVIGLGTDETENDMKGDAGYDHISTLLTVQPMDLTHLRDLSPKLKASKTDQRDALSSIILAVYMMMEHCKKLKWKKQIVLVTNGTGAMDPAEDDVLSTAEQITSNGIDLLILGVDFDDTEYGFKEEGKSQTKADNERMLRRLASQCGGKVATMAEAIDGLAIPYVKPVRPTPTYKGQLCLGDPSKFDTAITIDIERFFKVAVKRPPAASSYIVRGQTSDQGSIQTVDTNRSYQVPDPVQPGEMIAVERDELAKGYEYGRTAVHISEMDENITKLETDSSYQILGFIPKENVERYMILDNTNMIVPQKANGKATLALSSLIHALYELDSVAVARFVKKDMSEPQMTLLSPSIQEDIECLIENDLPFAEDLRSYRFPRIDQILTVSGKVLDTHRNLPSTDLLSAMDDYVNQMNLNDDGEQLSIEDTYSPANYSIENAIKFRAMHPGMQSLSTSQPTLGNSRPLKYLQDRSQTSLARLIDAADVKKVPPKAKGRRRYREQEKPLSGLDVDALFRKEDRVKISPDNAIPEYKRALSSLEKPEQVEDISKQMFTIIKNQIRNTYGDRYDQIIEGLSVMRQELLQLEMPHIYNDLMRSLRKQIIAEELGGNRKMLWYKIKISHLGLIDHDQLDSSEVSKVQAEDFLRLR